MQTPTTAPSETQSDNMSSHPTTPSSALTNTVSVSKSQQTPTQSKATRVAVPVIPVVPVIPTSPNVIRKAHRDSIVSTQSIPEVETVPGVVVEETPTAEALAAPAVAPAPKSWADLVKKQSAANAAAMAANTAAALVPVLNGLAVPKTESLGEVIGEINIESPSKVAFLKPRGLVNTGNMCYMNSVGLHAFSVGLQLTPHHRFFKCLYFAFLCTTFWTK